MSYKLRNTLILLVFIFIILGTEAFINYYHYPKEIEKINAEIKAIDQKTASSPEMEINLQALNVQIEANKLKLSRLDKIIEPKITPVMTYSYLDSIQDQFGSLNCNIVFDGDSVTPRYGYSIFNLRGEGSFYIIYHFLWALERGPKLYRITKMELHSFETLNTDSGKTDITTKFDIDLWALYADLTNIPPISNRLENIILPTQELDPFEPYITRNIPPNSAGLLEVEKANLIAILPDRIFVLDEQGKNYVLTVGDEVYLGWLTKIDVQNNSAEFILNKGGIVERVILSLSFGQKE